MDVSYIYNECKERLLEYKGTWVYDDFFKDSLGRKYFEDSIKGDKYIQENMRDDDIIEHIVSALESNKFINDFEQSMIG